MKDRFLAHSIMAFSIVVVASMAIFIAATSAALPGSYSGWLVLLTIMQSVGILLAAGWASRMLLNSEATRAATEKLAEVASRIETAQKENSSLWYRVK
jgi:hypothetical protein